MSAPEQRGRKNSSDPAFEPYDLPPPQTPTQSQSPRPLGTRGSAGRLNTIKRLGTSAGPLRASGQLTPPPSLKEKPTPIPNDLTAKTAVVSDVVPAPAPAAPVADEDVVPPLWFTLKTIPPVLVAAILGGK